MKPMSAAPLIIADTSITPGSRVKIDFPLADLYTYTPMAMPIMVIRGRRDGPVVFISGAIHGDEINGVEIIHRLLRSQVLQQLIPRFVQFLHRHLPAVMPRRIPSVGEP